MFVPSQSTFPIAPIKTQYYQNIRHCKTCNNSCYTKDIVSEKIIDNSFSIVSGRVKYVCSGCRRWQYFDYNNIRSLIGSYIGKSKLEWKEAKDKIYAKYPKHISFHLYKFLRLEFYKQKTTIYWEDQLSLYEVGWLNKKINELSDGKSCVDNIRVAIKGKSKQVKRYYNQKDNGCCGFYDTEVFNLMTGKTYLVGYNYGH